MVLFQVQQGNQQPLRVTTLLKLLRLLPNLAEASQTSSNLAEASQTSSNLAEASQTSSNLTEASQTSSNLAEASQTSSNLTKASQTSSNLAEASQTSSYLAKGLALVPSFFLLPFPLLLAGQHGIRLEADREGLTQKSHQQSTELC